MRKPLITSQMDESKQSSPNNGWLMWPTHFSASLSTTGSRSRSTIGMRELPLKGMLWSQWTLRLLLYLIQVPPYHVSINSFKFTYLVLHCLLIHLISCSHQRQWLLDAPGGSEAQTHHRRNQAGIGGVYCKTEGNWSQASEVWGAEDHKWSFTGGGSQPSELHRYSQWSSFQE